MAFVAALCSALSRRCEQQAQAQRQLEEQLRASEAEASALRRELAELRSGEALRAQRLAAREVAVDSWEAGRLKELPKLKAELKERLASQAEAHYQELEQQARRRLATAERAFHEQVRDLETELNEARAENAALGRKCFESYQARAQAQAASSQTQQQAQMQHQELHQLRANQTLMQQELLRCKASLSREEEAAAFLKARLQEAESSASRSDEVSRDLREWVLRSLNEVR
ncbi:unnamed protein product [Effrenium voratum]|uniref:Uncharacterized protein n=1 Tax=Effrenium voratum TaxID=2562239 RepID=A0AA36NN73_9DINO|nr:unnamed protein product [Effrenium voratum]